MWKSISLLSILSLSSVLMLPSEASPDLRHHRVDVIHRRSALGDGNLPSLASIALLFSPAGRSASDGGESTSNCSLILAKQRTRRPDLLNGFKRYRGGWDFTNKHYWASVAFTGAAGFVVGFLWFISFGMSLIILQSCKWKIYGEKRSCWRSGWVSSVLLFMLTWIKIIGCVLLSVGQDGFYKEATQTLHFIMNRSDFTVQSLRNISEHLSLAKSINVEQMLLPLKDQTEIDKLNGELNNSAAMLDEQTVKNSERVHKAQKAVRCWLIIMATLMLLLSMLGLLFYILRHRQAGYIFILIGWLFVAITFVVYGVFTIVDNVIADTCVSMKEWLDNPRAESALSSIIPCVDEQTTNQTLYQSKEIIHELVNVVNTAIIMTANSETVPKQKNYHFYNQSGPPMPILCSPFDSQLNIHQCHSEEVTLANASQVWKNHTCMVSVDGLCISPGRVTPSIYQELVTAVNVSYALYHYSPFVLNLQNCNFVRDTFRIIVSSHCPPIKHQLQLVIVGLVLIGVGLLLSLVLWLLYVNLLQRKEVLVSG